MTVDEKTFARSLPTLLLCRKAGAVTAGVGATLDAVRRTDGKPAAVILASDASERTKKQIRDKCAFYGVDLFEIPTPSDELGRFLGGSSLCAAAAIERRGPHATLVEKLKDGR
ncbi:MAG: ribosomal L7Ae/L30e/S12e/Gadd45 family protein [Clostridia bacterium]|nr:ribosomal L7Ae/L30e/S12e/Gadd45 family protein [Clostridia bacterium]